jgi:hypothetical protein
MLVFAVLGNDPNPQLGLVKTLHLKLKYMIYVAGKTTKFGIMHSV